MVEVYLNRAFDVLNSSALKVKSTKGECADILAETLEEAKKLYLNAHLSYQNGHSQNAKTLAETVIEFCELIENLSGENLENILELPLPPELPKVKHKMNSKKVSAPASLSLLDSLIRVRLQSGSRYYNQRLSQFSKVLPKVSAELQKLEKLH